MQVYSDVEMENFQLGYIKKTINYEKLSVLFLKWFPRIDTKNLWYISKVPFD